jgi:hypothetical protein
MDLNKVVKICALNLMNLVKKTLMHFGTAKKFAPRRKNWKPSPQKLSWVDTYREMAASDESWTDGDATDHDGLDEDKMKAKIEKFACIANKNLSTNQTINLTRE